MEVRGSKISVQTSHVRHKPLIEKWLKKKKKCIGLMKPVWFNHLPRKEEEGWAGVT